MFESPQIIADEPTDSICTAHIYDSYLMTHMFLTYLTRENGGRRNKDCSGSGLWYTLKGVTNELTIELSLN